MAENGSLRSNTNANNSFCACEPGIAAATMFTREKMKEVSDTQLRVAFDGDAVLFSDESERIYKAHGLDKFFEHEKAHENKPLDHVQYTHNVRCAFSTLRSYYCVFDPHLEWWR